jgi:hypothetical protein
MSLGRRTMDSRMILSRYVEQPSLFACVGCEIVDRRLLGEADGL